MKYLKKFKQNNEPQVGDYILCDIKDSNDKLAKFTQNNIGQIEEIYYSYTTIYKAKYKNVPPNLTFYGIKNLIGLQQHHIKYYSNDKEYLKIILNSKKYNL